MTLPPLLLFCPCHVKPKVRSEILYMLGNVKAGGDVPGEGGGPVELWD